MTNRFDAYVNKLDLNRGSDGPISVIGVGTKGDDEGEEDVRGESRRQGDSGVARPRPGRAAHRHHRADRKAPAANAATGRSGPTP